MKDNSTYTLYKNFVSRDFLDAYVDSTKRIIDTLYTEHNLRQHSAYFSDQSDNRESYAFSLWNGVGAVPPLPAFSGEQVSQLSRGVARLSLKMHEILGVPRDSRLMLNAQLYKGKNKPVTPHFDGEYFDFDVNPEDYSLNVRHALRPKKVAVLVLLNESEGGGTSLHGPNGTKHTVVGEPGDLLVFDNVNNLHSVDSLSGTSTRDDGLLRMTIGWRSLDGETVLIEDGQQLGEVTTDEARKIHYKFLAERWPSVYRSFRPGDSGGEKLPAF